MKVLPIIIIGAGPANLMAAQQLAERGYCVEVYEQNTAAARKFLVAGHGGFNLTHQEDIEQLRLRYSTPLLDAALRNFDNIATQEWLAALGIPTFAGSSGKIFPCPPTKPIQVLQAWLQKLTSLGVTIHYKQRFSDFTDTSVCINGIERPFQRLILGLGGASWTKTGSDGSWVPLLEAKGIPINPLLPANSGFNTLADYAALEGQFLKNIVVHFQGQQKQGEFVFTGYGIEGSPLYYMNRYLRGQSFPCTLHVDLKPQASLEKVQQLLQIKQPIATILKQQLKLSTTAIALLKKLDKETFTNPQALAQAIKRYPIHLASLRPIDEVISTAGGVSFEALDIDFSLLKFPKVHCIGEMVDWEAPTGGYLLQACFSMGVWVAQQIAKQDL